MEKKENEMEEKLDESGLSEQKRLIKRWLMTRLLSNEHIILLVTIVFG